jgi:hypothetical protein
VAEAERRPPPHVMRCLNDHDCSGSPHVVRRFGSVATAGILGHA